MTNSARTGNRGRISGLRRNGPRGLNTRVEVPEQIAQYSVTSLRRCFEETLKAKVPDLVIVDRARITMPKC
jgi:hypothetical protein